MLTSFGKWACCFGKFFSGSFSHFSISRRVLFDKALNTSNSFKLSIAALYIDLIRYVKHGNLRHVDYDAWTFSNQAINKKTPPKRQRSVILYLFIIGECLMQPIFIAIQILNLPDFSFFRDSGTPFEIVVTRFAVSICVGYLETNII